MFDRVVLHLGHQKTGTTSLQLTLRRNAKTLAQHGLYYDSASVFHHAFVRSFWHGPLRPKEAERGRAIRRRLARAREPRALISSEAMTLLDKAQAARLVDVLRQHARQVTGLVYVRHPLGLANSAVSQGVRLGRRLADIERSPRVLPLRQLIELWCDVLGAENLTVRPFERAQLVGGDIVDDVLTELELPQLRPSLTRVHGNEGMSVLGMHLLDRAMALFPNFEASGASLSVFDSIAGPKYVLPERALAKVRIRSAEHLAYLEAAHGIRLAEPVLVPTAPPDLDEATLNSLAEALFRQSQYSYGVERSLLGRLFGASGPYTYERGHPPGRLAALAHRIRLDRYIQPRGRDHPANVEATSPD